MGEVFPQVEKTYIPSLQAGKEPKLDIASNAEARTISGVFMFGSAARKVTKTKLSLSALQELPSHQKLARNQVKTTKKPSGWSRFGKFRVETKKTQGTNHTGDANNKNSRRILR